MGAGESECECECEDEEDVSPVTVAVLAFDDLDGEVDDDVDDPEEVVLALPEEDERVESDRMKIDLIV